MKKVLAALLAVSVTAALAGCNKPADEQLIDDITEDTSLATEISETVSETETAAENFSDTTTTSSAETSAESVSETEKTTTETSTATETTTAVFSESVSDAKIKTDGIDITGAWIESESREGIFVFDGENIFIISDYHIESYPYKFNGTAITVDNEDVTVKIENKKLFIIDPDDDTSLVLERYEVSDMPRVAKQQDIMGLWVDTDSYGNFCLIDENSMTEFFGVTSYVTSYKFDGDKMTSDNGDMAAVLFDNQLYFTDEYGSINITLKHIEPSKPSIADFDGAGYIYKNGEGLGYIDFKDGKEVITDQTPGDYSPAEIFINGNKVKFSLFGKTGEYTCYIKSREQEYADKQIFLLNDNDYIVFEK